MIIKLAGEINVSMDYLIGRGKFSSYDKEVLKRIDDIERLNADTDSIFSF